MLNNPFDEAEALLNARMATAIGENFTLIPRVTRPNKSPMDDPSRVSIDFCGVWYEKHRHSDGDKDASINKKSNMRYTVHSVSSMYVQVNACDLDYEPRQGDLVSRNVPGLTYSVIDVEPSGSGTLNIVLNELGDGPYAASA